MEKLHELLSRLAKIDDALDKLLAGDDLTTDQRAEHDRLMAERAKVVGAIERERDRQTREDERTALEAQAEAAQRRSEERQRRTVPAPDTNRLTTPDRPQVTRRETVPAEPRRMRRLPSGVEVNEGWIADPSKGFGTHMDFLRAVMDAGRGRRLDQRLRPLAMERREAEPGDEDPTGPYGGFLVPLAFTPNRPRLGGLYNSHGREMTAGSDEQGTYSDPYGGFLVPRTLRPGMMRLEPEGDPMGAYTTKIPMETPTVDIPARVDKNHTTSVSGGLRVYRRAETQGVPASRMEMELVELKAAALFGLAYATEEILARSLISFLALLEAGFSDEFNAKLIRERLEGTGVGQFEGVLNTPCIITVSAEGGQSADTIAYENVINMRARCWGYGSAIWLANHDTLPQLMLMNQSIGTGGIPVWQPSAREDAPDMLLGRPLFFTEFCPKLGDTGDLLLGCWKEYLEGTLSPIQSAESVHVRFVEHERAFKFWMENAGRVWWRTALTPAKSSQTLSPFVKLAAR